MTFSTPAPKQQSPMRSASIVFCLLSKFVFISFKEEEDDESCDDLAVLRIPLSNEC